MIVKKTWLASCTGMAALAMSLILSQHAAAAIITLDDFESPSGSNPANPPWNFKSEPSGTGAEVLPDTGNFFMQPGSNNYLRFFDNSGSGGINLVDGNTGPDLLYSSSNYNNRVTTVAFLFYDPNPGQSQLVVRLGNNNTGAQTSVDARIGDQAIANGGGGAVSEGNDFFTENELVEIDIIFNDTNASLDDYEGSQDVGSGKFDVWVVKPNGSKFLAVDEGDFRNGFTAATNPNIDSIVLQSFSGSTGEWYIDNVTLADGGQVGIISVIPEPASAVLMLLGAALSCGLRRRGLG